MRINDNYAYLRLGMKLGMDVILEELARGEREKVTVQYVSLNDRQLYAIDILRSNEYLTAYQHSAVLQLPLDDIYYFESVEGRTFAYSKDNVYEMKARLIKLEKQWENLFIRVSRTILLNWTRIICLRPMVNSRLEAELDNGEKVVVSRQFIPPLKNKFGIISDDDGI